MNFKLSPSDFAFLWKDCKRCFYLKVAKNFPPPSSIMATIFKTIDREMNSYFSGKRLEEIIPGFKPGVVQFGEHWVTSAPISLPDEEDTCYIKGKFDTVVKFDDGSYGVIDFKTSNIKPENIPVYGRQLHAYAYSLENPVPGSLSLEPVTKLGLIVYQPDKFKADSINSALLTGKLAWQEIPRNDKSFFDFLKQVITVLKHSEPPGGEPSCKWCTYRDAARRTGL